LKIFTIKCPGIPIISTSQQFIVFKKRAKQLFYNPPIVNINTKPNANNNDGIKCKEPP
jgi:hypothetical protein